MTLYGFEMLSIAFRTILFHNINVILQFDHYQNEKFIVVHFFFFAYQVLKNFIVIRFLHFQLLMYVVYVCHLKHLM